VLTPNTVYNFTFDIDNVFGTFTQYKMEILDNNSNVLATEIGTDANGSLLWLELNTLSNTSLRGRYSINLGSGLYYIDTDSYWPVHTEDIPARGTLKAFFTNFKTIRTFGEEQARMEYSRFLFLFLIMFIVLGFLSYTTQFDVRTGGGGLLLVWPLVTLFSAVGGFQVSYIAQDVLTSSDVLFVTREWISKWTVWLITSMFAGGYLLNQFVKERQ